VDRDGEIVVQTEDGGEGIGVGGVFIERGEGLVAPGADGVRGDGVGGHVDRVHRLPGAGVPRVPAGQVGVDRRQRVADARRERLPEGDREPAGAVLCHHAPRLSSTPISPCGP
jgi:hypothetical protein